VRFRQGRLASGPIAAPSTDGTLGTEVRARAHLRRHAPIALTLAFMVLVVALLVEAGIFVRGTVRASFRDAEGIRAARMHVADLLGDQLDEETGVRGYAAAREPILLSPYYAGRSRMSVSVARVRSDLERSNVPAAMPALTDAVDANRRWLREIAFPLILAHGPDARLQLQGKALVDRFRADGIAIDAALARRGAFIDGRAQGAVFAVGALALSSILAVAIAALIFSVQQYRLGERLERERAKSEVERRRLAEARAAYVAEKRIADTLQQAFSERLFPDLPTMSISATYLPATEESKVGGDWYDALQLPGDRVMLVIGDVTGHGIDAVVAMNKARQLLIGSALLDANPSAVLGRANLELARGKSALITAICAVVDTRTHEFSYATAGHPPPVLLEPGGRAKLLEFGSLPLGVAAETEYVTRSVQTGPGAMIVLYTDGVIEHSRDLASGEAVLLEAIESAATVPRGQAAKAIRDGIFSRRKITDDIAILTVRLWEASAPATASPRRIA
jgi:serine phosphatase RsbU (regulator of sigma subunit)